LSNTTFKCTQYLENINEGNCWDITDEIRKEMYKFSFVRNYNGIGKNDNAENRNETVTEYKRQKIEINKVNESDNECSTENEISSDSGSESPIQKDKQYKYKMIPNKINIIINKSEFIPSDINERFNLYLHIFNSNISNIKTLPYYLIPLASSLRFYFNEKKKSKQLISTTNNKDNLKSNISINEIYDYEFEALVASSIAALTLTFLNINVYRKNINTPFNDSCCIENNIKTYFNNMENFFLNKQRLELKRKLKINQISKLMKNEPDNRQFKRETQILAEFRNVLTINSNIMQILKLTDDLPEFQYIVSMHHYIWEEAFHRIIYQIKKDFNKLTLENIAKLFEEIFDIDGINNNKLYKKYLGYLNKNYNSVLSTARKTTTKSKL
ncbi:hypothetical protein PIROE2DRAFT_11534, partial [Piromyces sp. E2]